MKLSKQFSMYESEMDRFLADLKAKNPAIEPDQIAGRARLWDKPSVTLDEQDRTKSSLVSQKPYVYQSK